MRFAPEYVSNVLNENFEDAKELLLAPLMAIHYAHLVMLTEQGIVSTTDAQALRGALDGISLDTVRGTCFDGSCEDLFFLIERLICDAAGEDAAGRLHTARSRNDIDMTIYRMVQRQFVAVLAERVIELRAALIDLADRHRETVFGAHTHTQPAQPSTIAHYLLAVIEQLERDTTRLGSAYEVTNRNPLGACAITGTGFPINRERTSELLGFSGPTGNTYGSIATVDYLLESVAATAILLVGLGRVIQDFLLWCTMEFGYLRLSEGFVQSSSIMPQKRNPVALEHARAIGSKTVGQAQAIMTTVHNTPFGDIVDTEDDLQPLVASMFSDATRTLTLVAAAMRTADFNVERLASLAGVGGTTLTELADTLVRDQGMPFKTAHGIAARLLKTRTANPAASLSGALTDASTELLGTAIDYSEERLEQIMSPRHFVNVRKTLGGPAPSETARAVAASRQLLAEDGVRWTARRTALESSEQLLEDRVRAL
ncbi:MAG TPA: argininosuccinate lyase [Vicinamibacterales bacterium]|nr:argininosuccinate lyase [Vicinamibacterales bacterium]